MKKMKFKRVIQLKLKQRGKE